MTESLTTFGDLYREATPEERRELVRLRLNRSSELPIKSASPSSTTRRMYQGFSKTKHLVARTLDSSNLGVIWDKFHIYQGPLLSKIIGHHPELPAVPWGNRA
jgi:hypothetical protein